MTKPFFGVSDLVRRKQGCTAKENGYTDIGAYDFGFIFLFVVSAAGVVSCGIPKKRPRTSSIVQFIF